MALSYGFYNSVAGDRTYNAIQLSSIFDGVIADGVFATVGSAFVVSAGTGLQVTVGTGRAWFNHTWTYNDSSMALAIGNPHATLNRIDTVVLEVDESEAVRANRIFVLAGTPGSSPVPPTLTNTSLVHQYALAHVSVPVGLTQVLASHITNKIGTSSCPFVTGIIDTVNIETLLTQWNSEFDTWFDDMKDQLTTDAAGNLQTQINAIVGNASAPLITLLTLKNHDHSGGEGSPISTPGLADGAVNNAKLADGAVITSKMADLSATTAKIANDAVTTAKIANDAVDDTKAGNRVLRIPKRKGGSATNWNVAGYNDYIPGGVLVQAGSHDASILAGMSSPIQSVYVSFPVAFSAKPLVFITLESPTESIDGGIKNFFINWLTDGTMRFYVNFELTAVQTINRSFAIHWMAIGPE